MVDRAIVQRKLAALSEYRGQLQEYATISVEAYLADWKIQRIVERTLQMMIGNEQMNKRGQPLT